MNPATQVRADSTLPPHHELEGCVLSSTGQNSGEKLISHPREPLRGQCGILYYNRKCIHQLSSWALRTHVGTCRDLKTHKSNWKFWWLSRGSTKWHEDWRGRPLFHSIPFGTIRCPVFHKENLLLNYTNWDRLGPGTLCCNACTWTNISWSTRISATQYKETIRD